MSVERTPYRLIERGQPTCRPPGRSRRGSRAGRRLSILGREHPSRAGPGAGRPRGVLGPGPRGGARDRISRLAAGRGGGAGDHHVRVLPVGVGGLATPHPLDSAARDRLHSGSGAGCRRDEIPEGAALPRNAEPGCEPAPAQRADPGGSGPGGRGAARAGVVADPAEGPGAEHFGPGLPSERAAVRPSTRSRRSCDARLAARSDGCNGALSHCLACGGGRRSRSLGRHEPHGCCELRRHCRRVDPGSGRPRSCGLCQARAKCRRHRRRPECQRHGVAPRAGARSRPDP